MRTRETDVEPFVNLSELTEIELLILRRMREYTVLRSAGIRPVSRMRA